MENEPIIPKVSEQSVYDHARELQIRKLRGEPIEPNEQEAAAIRTALEEVRSGKENLGLDIGYSLARWLMLNNFFWPGSIEITETDKEIINGSAQKYLQTGDLYQLASLIHTGKALGIEIDYGEATEGQKAEIEKELTTII